MSADMYYCPVCDRQFTEAETVVKPLHRECPVCGFTVSPARRSTKETRLRRIAALERQIAEMRSLIHALATMPAVEVEGASAPCPWCLQRAGRHTRECPVSQAQDLDRQLG
jgi:hypothetical protein